MRECSQIVRSVLRGSAILAGLAAVSTSLAVNAVLASASPLPSPAATDKVDCVAYDATGRCEVVGVVYALAQIGDRTYIGGSFTSVAGVPRANVAAIGPDGKLDLGWTASTDGVVYALAASADGDTLFMGGGFTTVNGVQRGRLAAVSPTTGEVSTTWTTTTSNNLVRALAADGDSRLYVGGSFGRIGGRAIPRLAAVDQDTGAVDTGFAPNPGATVRALAVSDGGDRLYAGGGFSTIGGLPRPGAAELDAGTGAVTQFAPTDGGVVISMDVNAAGRLFFGTTSNRTWAYDPSIGGTPAYRVRTGGDVQAILATDDEVYIGGHFNTMPEFKLERVAIASFDPATGTPTSWNPRINGSFGVWALDFTGTDQNPGALSVGGDFTRVAGLGRRGYAKFLIPS